MNSSAIERNSEGNWRRAPGQSFCVLSLSVPVAREVHHGWMENFIKIKTNKKFHMEKGNWQLRNVREAHTIKASHGCRVGSVILVICSLHHWNQSFLGRMLPFLEHCQIFLKFCGYCAYGATENSPYVRWSGVANKTMTCLFIYFVGTNVAFIFDSRQSRDERIFVTIILVAILELLLVHITFIARKSKVLEFFNHCELFVNQSKFHATHLKFIFRLKNQWSWQQSAGASRRISNFYFEAERKTIAIKDGAQSFTMWYNAFLTVPFAHTVIFKIIIEKCASEPKTWHVPLKAR